MEMETYTLWNWQVVRACEVRNDFPCEQPLIVYMTAVVCEFPCRFASVYVSLAIIRTEITIVDVTVISRLLRHIPETIFIVDELAYFTDSTKVLKWLHE